MNQTLNNSDDVDNCTQSLPILRHPVGAVATFFYEYTAPGRYWVTVYAYRVAPITNRSETMTSNISVDVSVRPTLTQEAGVVFLLVPNSTYVDEPLILVILIQNRLEDVTVTANWKDHDERRPVRTSAKTALRDVIDRNRYRVAASSRLRSTNVDELASYFRRDVGHVFRSAGRQRITLTVSRACVRRPRRDDDHFTLSTTVEVSLHFFLPRDAMLARYMLWSRVRLPVRLSVTSRYCIETTGRIELFFGMGLPSTYHTML